MEYEKNIKGKPYPKFILAQLIMFILKSIRNLFLRKKHEKYKNQKI